MIIPPDPKREATVHGRVGELVVGTLQRTSCEEGIVGGVEGNCSKLLPISHI